MKYSSLAVFAVLLAAASATLYDFQTTDVTQYNALNFDRQVTNNRAKGITIVHFYQDSGERTLFTQLNACFYLCFFSNTDSKSKQIKSDYEKLATDMKGMLRVGAIDCSEFPNVCEKEKIAAYPTVRVYPPHPIPTSEFTVS